MSRSLRQSFGTYLNSKDFSECDNPYLGYVKTEYVKQPDNSFVAMKATFKAPKSAASKSRCAIL